MNPICLRGAKEICKAVGENPKEMAYLVREVGLPAWKRSGRGVWKALPEDLLEWAQYQRDQSLGERVGRGYRDTGC